MNLLKTISGLALMCLLCMPNAGFGQGKVTDFKSLIQEREYGGVELIITPLAFDPYKKDYKSHKYNYGVRICYTVGGEKKTARQDMSYDIHTKSKYKFTLAYGRKYNTGNVKVTNISYFDMDETPRSQWPSKEDCN